MQLAFSVMLSYTTGIVRKGTHHDIFLVWVTDLALYGSSLGLLEANICE